MIAAYQRISRADGDLGKDGKDKSNSIENQKELEKMLKVSPNYCQGYYFGKPCPYEKFYHDFIEQA